MLKLSLPTLYGWIIMFYCLFHLWLNILAELTGFGDREFYKASFLCRAMFLHACPHRMIGRSSLPPNCCA